MPDYIYMLESRLSAEQRAAMLRVQELAVQAGTNLYLTGGAVRDLIAGATIRDLDFTIEGNPSRLAQEAEKGGAQIVSEDEKLRQVELLFAGNVDCSISAAREEVFARPGTRPEIRWSTIMEDLRRRDFSINAIALSLNAGSRGLLLDPTNGLADIEKREVRVLSIHSFTNQPVRLLRLIRYSARMGFNIESRTGEWFALAMERGMAGGISPEDAGRELRQLGREENPTAILKAWESRGLIETIHPQLARRHPDYEMLARMLRARDDVMAAGLRPRLSGPVIASVFGRMKPSECAAALQKLGFRSSEAEAVRGLDAEADKAVKMLAGRKTATPGEAYTFLEHTPAHVIVYILAESSNSKVLSKVRNYIAKWRPLRQGLPAAAAELEALGVARGPKFDKIIEDLFNAQLAGKGKLPEDRTKLLRKLAGIKDEPKKKEEKKKPEEKGKKKLAGKDGKALPAEAGVPEPSAAGPSAASASGSSAKKTSSMKALPRRESSGKSVVPPKKVSVHTKKRRG